MRTPMEKQEYVREITEAIRRRDERPYQPERKKERKEDEQRRHKS